MRSAQGMKKTNLVWRLIPLVLCACLVMSFALADGVMPVMPDAPTTAAVYWQLVSVEQEPTVMPNSGYTVEYATEGLSPDLTDALMAESLQEGQPKSTATLSIFKGERALRQTYEWTALPIYMEPGVTYPIEITGTQEAGSDNFNALLGVYVQGVQEMRISAGGYNSHDTQATLPLSATMQPLYKDGRLAVSLVLRDVNDMFRLRVVYTYQLMEGVRPTPTPIPGFVPAEEAPQSVPAHYVPVEGNDRLWSIVTAPETYRAWGYMNGVGPNFFAADAAGTVAMDEPVANPDADFDAMVRGFVPESLSPDAVPEYYIEENGLYYFTTRDGETLYRIWGRVDGRGPAFYPADANGQVSAGAQPVQPQVEYGELVEGFGVAEGPADVPVYRSVGNGLYAFEDREGVTHYRVWGRMDGAEPAFYPADENGAVAEDAQPVTPEADFVEHIEGFVPKDAPADDTFYYTQEDVPGLWSFVDVNGQTQYRAYGELNCGEAAFYPADETGNVATDAEPVDPEDDLSIMPPPRFEAAQAQRVPEIYKPVEGVTGLYSFVNRQGETEYRVYGAYGRAMPDFYPADASGVPMGDIPADVNADALNVQPEPTAFVSVVATPAATAQGSATLTRTMVEPQPTVLQSKVSQTSDEQTTNEVVTGTIAATEAPKAAQTSMTSIVTTAQPIDETQDTVSANIPATQAPAQTPMTSSVSTAQPGSEAQDTVSANVQTNEPAAQPTEEPTQEPTEEPTEEPTAEPTDAVPVVAPVEETEHSGFPWWWIVIGLVVVALVVVAIVLGKRKKQ